MAVLFRKGPQKGPLKRLTMPWVVVWDVPLSDDRYLLAKPGTMEYVSPYGMDFVASQRERGYLSSVTWTQTEANIQQFPDRESAERAAFEVVAKDPALVGQVSAVEINDRDEA